MSASFACRSRGALAGAAGVWRVGRGRVPLCPLAPAKPHYAGVHTTAATRGTLVAERAMSGAASSSSSRTGGSRDAAARADWKERPKAWEDAAREVPWYTPEDIMSWRAEFGFARRQHSMAQFGYTDDELLEWRAPFDELATKDGISYPDFERFVCRKYKEVIPDSQLSAKVKYFWDKFDRDSSNHIDFGEFIIVGLAFDIAWAKEKIRKDGIEETFSKYAEDDFMFEPHFFQLMVDFRFFVATATDVRKLVLLADQDRDGLVSLADFVMWSESVDFDTTGAKRKRRDKGGAQGPRSSPPDPEPE